MAIRFLKHRWQRITIMIIVSLVTVILIGAFILNTYWTPILSTELKKQVNKGTEGLYKIDFSEAHLHILEGRVVIFNLNIRPDTAVYNARKKYHIAPNNLFELHVKRLVLLHIHPLRLYFRHKLDINEIIINQPELKATYQLNHKRDTVRKDYRTLWQKISKSLKSIHVNRILLNDVRFKYEDFSGYKVAISELKEMNISATDMLIDSTTQADRSRLLYCKDVLIQLDNYHGNTSNGLYQFKMNSLRLSWADSKLSIKGLDLKPIKPDVFFNKTKADRFSLHLDSAVLNKFDYLLYHKYRMVNAASLDIAGGSLSIFGNYKAPPKPTDRVITFPNAALSHIDPAIYIGNLNVKHFNITYNEYNQKSRQVGEVIFNDIWARFKNVTNNEDSLKKNHYCAAKISSAFMGHAPTTLDVTFNLTDSARSYSYKGSMGQIDGRELNKATIPLALIKIKSGTLKSLSFDFNANRYASKGRVTMLYNDVKIDVLKADTVSDVLKKKLLATLYANVIMIKHDNPDQPGGPPRYLDVNFKRPTNFPFFKTIWNTLFMGIKYCGGVSQQKEQQARDKMSEHEYKVAHRDERKAERKAKRAERKAERQIKRELRKQRNEAEKSAAAANN